MAVSPEEGMLSKLARKLSSPRKSSAGNRFRLNDAEMKAAFRIFDKRKKGAITKGDIRRVLNMLGQEATTDEVEELMGEIDVDGDGTISLGEFKTMMERLMETNEEDDRQLLEDTFNEFDVYGDGLIGVEDLIVVFRKLGDDEVTKEEIEQMIIDATGTPRRKKATFEEFKAVLKGY